ncbi:MAG: hypothetical protein ACRC1T_05655 [Clostridium chrysemydis]|uniref:hypothetical protein n=1 Tax=Clostridium chrysemydis TaxID=2665504 RepID=UPI003F34D1C5
MIVFRDMCFCINKECKKKNKCQRALENYSDEQKKGKYFSVAEFKCDKNSSMFIKIPSIGL